MPMPYLFISSSRLEKRLDRFERELTACHDRLNYLSEIVIKLGYVNTNLLRMYERLNTIDEGILTMQRAWDDVVESVRQLKDLPAAVDAGFDKLQARIEELLAQAGNTPSVAEMQQLGADIKEAVAQVHAAIPANTV